MIDGVFDPATKPSSNCMASNNAPAFNNPNGYFDIKFTKPSVVETVLVINRESAKPSEYMGIIGTDLWVGMSDNGMA